MKLFNFKKFLNNTKNQSEIHNICNKYHIKNYTINPDMSIDVDESVFLNNLGYKPLNNLPIKFNHVSGDFYCGDNHLTSLEGCPRYVGGIFNCSNNQLTSLHGSPDVVIDSFLCNHNNIVDFKGFPEFYECEVAFYKNPVNEILYKIPDDERCKFIHLLNEYDVIRNGKTIIRDRLEEAYYGIGMELPENITIKGYEII